MFDKLRKMVEERMNPRPQMQPAIPMQKMARPMLPTNAQAAPAKLQPKQPIGQWRAPEAQQPYTQDNVRTNSLVDAGQLPESSREGRLRVMANRGLQSEQVNPVDMDLVPGNLQVGRHPAYYQGSNPFRNQPRQNVYNNISPMPVDEMRYGRQIQPGYTSDYNGDY
jgi:hypothetical protein